MVTLTDQNWSKINNYKNERILFSESKNNLSIFDF
jgi:hypothetical protein